MKIFLDDLYETDRASLVPVGYRGAKNFSEFKQLIEEALQSGEKIEAISFDNDLGEGETEGWQIAKWLTEEHPEIFAQNPEISIHSANPEGKKAIEHYIRLGQNHFSELIEAKTRPHPFGELERK